MTSTPIENKESYLETPLKKPDFRQETRLGLVLYGGVSLAVYMNGVCREFYNAMRGRGIYKLIKALTDSDIVVDIVSGTSVGGLMVFFIAMRSRIAMKKTLLFLRNLQIFGARVVISTN